jgi:hypothetical protein
MVRAKGLESPCDFVDRVDMKEKSNGNNEEEGEKGESR